MIIERWISLVIQIPVARIFLRFGYYFNTNWMRKFSRLFLSTLPLNRARWVLLSPAKKRRECFPVLSATFWATIVCIYLPICVFRDAQTPSRTYCRRNGAPGRKTSELNSDSDWPCAQINSCLDLHMMVLRNNTKSDSLTGFIAPMQLPTSFLSRCTRKQSARRWSARDLLVLLIG